MASGKGARLPTLPQIEGSGDVGKKGKQGHTAGVPRKAVIRRQGGRYREVQQQSFKNTEDAVAMYQFQSAHARRHTDRHRLVTLFHVSL